MAECISNFIFIHGELCYELPISFDDDIPIEELVNIFVREHSIPPYLEEELEQKLKEFITEQNEEYFGNEISNIISEAKNDSVNLDNLSKEWEKIMREEITEFGEKRCAGDDELFAMAYHKMVHSPALENMIRLEHVYNQTIKKWCEENDREIEELSSRQTTEMNTAVDQLGQSTTEAEINELAAQHFEVHTMRQVQMMSELDTIKETQRREYREMLMLMLEEVQAHSSIHNLSTKSFPTPFRNYELDSSKDTQQTLEESFTIHLGSQLKQMHNIRILTGNILDLCAVDNSQLSEPTPQVLQTSLALYSNDLQGLVLITDNTIKSRANEGLTKICQQSTDFHFPNMDDQLDSIAAIKEQGKVPARKSKYFQSGDFYITRHSNLSQVHVIFHLVGDDSLRVNEINSRHPVVLGLRNILKTACSNDITSITLPLLLNYEMSEEMTISWCEKRAELVFKCVKGFMIEMASWGGSDLKNLQFMLPQNISAEVFQSLTEMLPRIFKVSNPLVLKSQK